MTRIAVILHGCGARDGSEIHESTLSLLALDQAGAQVQCFAPFEKQAKVINHLTGQGETEQRWMNIEAARIARGRIKNLTELNPSEFEGILIPGGSGTALNLCTFASAGSKMTVHNSLAEILTEFHRQRKPIGAICIAPVILAKVFGSFKPELTIGTDVQTAAQMCEMGARHIEASVDKCIVDRKNLLLSTPAYMLARSIGEVWPGVQKLCFEMVAIAKEINNSQKGK